MRGYFCPRFANVLVFLSARAGKAVRLDSQLCICYCYVFVCMLFLSVLDADGDL